MLRLSYENMQNKIDIPDDIIDNLTRSLEKTLDYEEFCENAEISLSFVDNEAIKELNKETRNKDAVTDVLSFPMLEQDEDGTLIIYDEDIIDDYVLLGDIVISAERAVQQAEEYGHSLMREICFLAVHSALHLLGYDHERSPEEEKLQFKKQEEILSSLGITR